MRTFLFRQFTLAVLMMPLLVSMGNAEIFRDIRPLTTLEELKVQFPNAKFEKISPGWAKKDDAFYQINGEGLPGKMYVALWDQFDSRFKPIEQPSSSHDTSAASSIVTMTESSEDDVEVLTEERDLSSFFEETDDDSGFVVRWVRWLPDYLIPIERLVTRYGQPTKSGFDEETYAPYKEWATKGIWASITDNGKFVYSIEYGFTRSELRSAWNTKHGFVPDYLKDKPASPASQKVKPKPTSSKKK